MASNVLMSFVKLAVERRGFETRIQACVSKSPVHHVVTLIIESQFQEANAARNMERYNASFDTTFEQWQLCGAR